MAETQVFEQNLLKIHLTDGIDSIHIGLSGKSVERDPGKMITPILLDALKNTGEENRLIILNFCQLDFMNSSTITPIIKILDRAKRGNNRLTVLYNKALKWQDLSFSALEIFETRDKRIEIKGIE
ncbi:hypothetical protein [Desulfosarcina sp.]|uniref:hypothetical protein n=1 Tax=Desulfosarcina sp. TaxID=2027861 RepID=UPI0035634B68